TCVNDVTAVGLFEADASFEQWTRAKSLDSFGPIGPVIATGLDVSRLRVRAVVDGRERPRYGLGEMIFSPLPAVSLISRDLTLAVGDVISCGTSTGVGALEPGATVQIAIDGIGVLENRYS